MCGIAGIVKLDPRDAVEETRLKRMCDTLRHRGPDGEGFFADGPVGLGNRRLAIVDVAGGPPPRAQAKGKNWVPFKGEICKHPPPRPPPLGRGDPYPHRADSLTVRPAMPTGGEACVER